MTKRRMRIVVEWRSKGSSLVIRHSMSGVSDVGLGSDLDKVLRMSGMSGSRTVESLFGLGFGLGRTTITCW